MPKRKVKRVAKKPKETTTKKSTPAKTVTPKKTRVAEERENASRREDAAELLNTEIAALKAKIRSEKALIYEITVERQEKNFELVNNGPSKAARNAREMMNSLKRSICDYSGFVGTMKLWSHEEEMDRFNNILDFAASAINTGLKILTFEKKLLENKALKYTLTQKLDPAEGLSTPIQAEITFETDVNFSRLENLTCEIEEGSVQAFDECVELCSKEEDLGLLAYYLESYRSVTNSRFDVCIHLKNQFPKLASTRFKPDTKVFKIKTECPSKSVEPIFQIIWDIIFSTKAFRNQCKVTISNKAKWIQKNHRDLLDTIKNSSTSLLGTSADELQEALINIFEAIKLKLRPSKSL